MNFAFVYTKYQLAFLNRCRDELNNGPFILLLANGVTSIEKYSPDDFHYHIENEDRPKTIIGRRQLKNEIIDFAKRIETKIQSFWLASDDHPISQILLKKVGYDQLCLFEDGIGSYVPHRFLNMDRELKSILAKIANFILYFPYYRSTRLCGSTKADRYYSYYSEAFPLEKDERKKKTINYKESVNTQYYGFQESFSSRVLREGENSKCIGVIIGQPLMTDCGISAERYASMLQEISEYLFTHNKTGVLYYKPHPRESATDINKFMEVLSEKIEIYPLPQSVEVTEIVSFLAQHSEVSAVSVASTALLHLSKNYSLQNVYAVDFELLKVPKGYYDVLKRFNVKILSLNI